MIGVQDLGRRWDIGGGKDGMGVQARGVCDPAGAQVEPA